MSVSILVGGGLTKPIYKKLTTTSTTDVYTATQKQERVVSAQVVNDTAGAIVCKLIYTDTANATDVIYWEQSVGANAATTVDFPIRLLTGHKIKATASGANALTVSIVRGVIAGRNISGGTMGVNA